MWSIKMYKKNHFVLKQTGSWEMIKKAINVLNQVTETNLLVTDFLSVNEIQILKGSCLFWKASGGLFSEAVRVTHPWGQSSAPWGGGETLCDGVAGHHRTQTARVSWQAPTNIESICVRSSLSSESRRMQTEEEEEEEECKLQEYSVTQLFSPNDLGQTRCALAEVSCFQRLRRAHLSVITFISCDMKPLVCSALIVTLLSTVPPSSSFSVSATHRRASLSAVSHTASSLRSSSCTSSFSAACSIQPAQPYNETLFMHFPVASVFCLWVQSTSVSSIITTVRPKQYKTKTKPLWKTETKLKQKQNWHKNWSKSKTNLKFQIVSLKTGLKSLKLPKSITANFVVNFTMFIEGAWNSAFPNLSV